MNTDDIVSQGLGRSLFRLTWPMLFGVLALMSYQLADSFWVARLGVEPLAALGFTLPVYQIMIGLQVGLGIATTAIISRTLGAGDPERARRLGGVIVIVGALATGSLVVLLWLLQGPIMLLLGADDDLLPMIREFWAVWLLAAWLGAMVYFGYSLHRAQGDTRFPGLMMVATGVLNLILDPIFIFTFNWGLPGAAWATVVSFGLGCLVTYPRLRRYLWLSFDRSGINLRRAMHDLTSIAAPAMLSQLMPGLAAGLATGLVAAFGSAAVAAWGIGARLEMFSIVVVLALTMSMPPIVGRFLGAGDLLNARRLIRLGVGFVLVWQLALAVGWLLVSGALVSVVTDNADVASVLLMYLQRVPFSFAALGVCMLMVSVCNALGMPMRALLISCLRLFLCYLPLLWLGSLLGGMNGLLLGAAIGNVGAGVLAWTLYQRGMGRLRDTASAARAV